MRSLKLFFLVFCFNVNFVCAEELSAYESCLLKKIQSADVNKAANEIIKECEKSAHTKQGTDEKTYQYSAIEERLEIDKSNEFKPFTLMAFKPNYIMPLVYNRSGYDASVYQQLPEEQDSTFDNAEAQFQISIKTPLAVNLFNKDIILYTAYTSRSFWQVYNSRLSRPFRETNHEPEIWLQTTRSTSFMGFDNRINMLGVSHQSNGRSNVLSRSWNRIYATFSFEKESSVFVVKLWKRYDESPEDDDNPDITDYMGHGEFRYIYKKDSQTFNLMTRNNIESGFERGATELSWSFPIGKRKDLRGYIQVFTGYGESLIDYNQSVNRIGFGISLSDWL
ncbi:MAG: phospholipase A [Gammaproteobacteria bacterium]|nr:phospholipase A [Gammaproteobacteria bacterium]